MLGDQTFFDLSKVNHILCLVDELVLWETGIRHYDLNRCLILSWDYDSEVSVEVVPIRGQVPQLVLLLISTIFSVAWVTDLEIVNVVYLEGWGPVLWFFIWYVLI